MGANDSKQAGSCASRFPNGEWRSLAVNVDTLDEYLLPGEQDGAMGKSETPSHPGDTATTTATPSPQARKRLSLLAKQHERLILELFTFKDAAQFQAWLRSPQVWGSWLEFLRDSARPGPAAGEEMDKAKAAQQAKDAVQKKSPRYMLHYPDKRDWTADDHTVRFMAVVIYDNLLTGMWSSGDWSYRALDIAKSVYEVLVFLRSTDLTVVDDTSPPDYTA